ncbi:MAG: MATE family efflux transporter [Lachnospiraceae bacterium]|nr:MATE family efflux transporter [Lachnospiraceae bacterium]
MRGKEKVDRSGYLFSNRDLTALLIPLVIEQLLSVLVGMADSIMVASVGEAAVSGVSLVDNIMVLLINVFAALATGGAVVAGQYLGQKQRKKASQAATQLIWFITICAVVITILIYLCKSWILHGVFGKIEEDVMRHADIYLMIVAASIPFIALYNGGAAIFRTMGNSEVSMRVSMIMNVINVTGNAVLIYGFHRGTEGVAIPTLISRMTAAILIVMLLMRPDQVVSMERSLSYRFDWKMIKSILKIGIPNGLENSMFQLGKIIVLSLVSTFGTFAIAANAVSNTIASFQVLPGMAIALGVTTVIARCVGAGDYEQVKYYTKKLMGITYLSMLVTNGIVVLVLPWILKAYYLSEVTAATTTQIVTFYAVCSILIWPLSFTTPAMFRAAGDARMCMIISVVSMWIFRIVFSYILGRYMGMGVFGVWVAMIVDWIARAVCFLLRLKSGKWKHQAIV